MGKEMIKRPAKEAAAVDKHRGMLNVIRSSLWPSTFENLVCCSKMAE